MGGQNMGDGGNGSRDRLGHFWEVWCLEHLGADRKGKSATDLSLIVGKGRDDGWLNVLTRMQ
jgi:hypothetical protein